MLVLKMKKKGNEKKKGKREREKGEKNADIIWQPLLSSIVLQWLGKNFILSFFLFLKEYIICQRANYTQKEAKDNAPKWLSFYCTFITISSIII